MSFKKNSSQQIKLNDRFNNLTEREQRMLEKSWASAFARDIFPLIDEKPFNVLYCENNGRPNTPVNVCIGSLLLKEMFHLTDEQLVDSIIFDTQFQYALHLTSYEEIPYSDRTPSRFRERLLDHETLNEEDLLKNEIERLGTELAKFLKINPKIKRMDSLMVATSSKDMGRLELIYTCVSNAVKRLVEINESDKLPQRLLKYAEPSDKNSVCYRLESDEVKTRLDEVTADALEVLPICGESTEAFDEYAILKRVIKDQTTNGKLKPNKEISPQSLQNPSDEDATFRRKAGESHKGYVANVVEDCGENGNIITQYEYEVNRHPDTEFGSTAIERMGLQEETVILISDGAYASEENFKSAKENNINFVTTNLTGEKPPEIITEFKIEEEAVTACPGGYEPIDSSYNEEKGVYKAHFDKEKCEQCPHREDCPVKIQKKSAVVQLKETTINRAEYAKKLSTEEFKGFARIRNGVEGIPSILRRHYGVDNMPVRGLLFSKLWFGFKIGAINAKRVIAAAL